MSVRARIAIEHSRSREVSSSGSISTTDEGTPSSPREVPSLSPTTGSQEEFVSEDDSWDPVDDIEPSESASRPASRPPPSAKTRVYVETGAPEQSRREPSRPRLPPAPEPEPRRRSRREERDPREYREPARTHHSQHRRRDPSSHSDSVGSYEQYPGYGRPPYGNGPPPPHHQSPQQQWEFVPHHEPRPGYATSSIGSQGLAYNPFTGNPMPPPGTQLIHYQQPHPAYYPTNPLMPQYPHASPLSPTASSHSGYFDPHRMQPPHMPMMPMPYYPPYPMHPMQGMQPMAPPPPGASPAEEAKFNKLQDMILEQERKRQEREDQREAKMAAAKKAAEDEAEAASKLAEAEKKAKAAAETEAASKAKAADEKYQKALEEMKNKAEAAQKAEKEAKKAEEEAKKEAAALKPAEAPIKFKDAVGRTFSFPWSLCKTWKGIEGLIKQAFLHVDVIGHHVQEGHYDLVGPNGEIILPQVWASTVQPDWTVTMHMWPMAEAKKESKAVPQPAATRPRSRSADRGFFGRRRSTKKKKSPPAIVVPTRPSNASAVPPPPPPAPSAPSATVVPDSLVVDQSGAAHIVREKRGKSREPVPPLLAWSAASMGMRPKVKR